MRSATGPEIKLSILEEYAKPYNQILLSHQLHPIYIDGFAGAGHHTAKGSDRVIEGSPTRALSIDPPFDALNFVDLNSEREAQLKKLSADHTNVLLYQGDCNKNLTEKVFPKISYVGRLRALCLLDPYGLHLDWQTIELAGKSKTIEIFLNFPVMDMNRNVFWRDHERVLPSHQDRMTKFWGDESWKNAAYKTIQGLF